MVQRHTKSYQFEDATARYQDIIQPQQEEERHIIRENTNGSYAKQPVRFKIVTENGIELLRSGRRIDDLFKIGSLLA